MQPFSPISEFVARVPPFVKVLVLVGAVSFVAIFAFNVAVGTVLGYSIFALLCGSHLFMHGSHADHPGHKTTGPEQQEDLRAAELKRDRTEHHTGC
ncbi:MAG TPA: DUF2933 domain-containing protein [Anaerolineales bacterium]|nr:DUF2933 domain-containing protein [Anaerolineales bacterium]